MDTVFAFNYIKHEFHLSNKLLNSDIIYLASQWDFHCKDLDKSKAWELGICLVDSYCRGAGLRHGGLANNSTKYTIFAFFFILVIEHVVDTSDIFFKRLKSIGLTDRDSALKLSESMLAVTQAEIIIGRSM